MTWWVAGSVVAGAVITSQASKSAAGAASAGASSAAEIQAEATRDAAKIAGQAQVQSAEIMAETTGQSIAEIRRQFNVTDQQFEMYRQAGPVGLAGYYGLLGASPIPWQREAAQGMLGQMGGRLSVPRQAELAGGARAPYASTLGPAPTKPVAPSGGGISGGPGGLTQFQQQQLADASQPAMPWNAAARASVSDANVFGVPDGGDYETALAQYNKNLAAYEQQQRADAQARAAWEGTPQYETVTDEYDIPEVTPIEFETSPGYEWRLAQGQKAIENAAAARGQQLSPQTQMALSQYAQGQASQEYDSFLDRYYQSLTPFSQLYAGGQAAAARSGQTGMEAATTIAGLTQESGAIQAQGILSTGALQSGYATQAGAAQAAGLRSASGYEAQNIINQGNIWGGVLQQGTGLYGAYQGGVPSQASMNTWGYM